MKRTTIKGACLALALLGAGTWMGSGGVFRSCFRHNPLTRVAVTSAGLEDSMRRGDRIIDALRAYHADRGTYPQELGELVPAYVEEIQVPTVGYQKWEYRTDPKHGFVLTFPLGPMYQKCWFEGSGAEWQVDM